MGAEQTEVLGFFSGHSRPVQVVGRWHAGKAPDGIQRQIDRIELDVG
jgi:hypothetical protein